MGHVELGLGLLSIAKRWGVAEVEPPPEAVAIEVVERAWALGIRFFDTAPSYGDSEVRFARALASGTIDRERITIATKMGEHWDAATGTLTVDHGRAALIASLERSLARLGRIDLLQIHKATPENVVSADVFAALDRAAELGVTAFGASVSDLETARAACRSGRYAFLQFPFNDGSRHLGPVFALLRDHGMKAIVNRPYAMGRAVTGDGAGRGAAAFATVLGEDFDGVVLTGTSSPVHLAENAAAFAQAKNSTLPLSRS